MNYLGDFPTGATVYVPFHTFDSTGASVTLTGLAVTDIEIYKNGGTTQRSSDAGYTLLDTDGIDFDGITGIHGFKIDLSDDTDAGFFAAGNEYMVVVSSVTVDSKTVSFVAATFSIERSGGALALLKNATYGLSAIEALVDDLEGRLTAARAGYLDNINNSALQTTVAQTGDAFARLGAPAGASVSADIAAVKSDTAAILEDTGTTLPATLATIDGIVDDILVDTGTTLNTLILDIPTVAEFEARTLAAADYVVVTDIIAGATTVGSVTGAVGSVTGAVGSVTGNVGGNVVGSVASVTAGVTLADDAITAAKFDESTAYPLKSADTGATAVARTGADSDTLETLSDQLDGTATAASIAALNNLSAAQVNAEVVDVLRTDTIPDSYATDGSQPTIAQAILSIQQFLQERAVSGTTVTVKKPDGSTTAMTFTLNDGTNPTSITRAS